MKRYRQKDSMLKSLLLRFYIFDFLNEVIQLLKTCLILRECSAYFAFCLVFSMGNHNHWLHTFKNTRFSWHFHSNSDLVDIVMLVTLWSRLIWDVGGRIIMLTTFFVMWFSHFIKSVTNIQIRSRTSQTCHQHIWSQTSVTNIDVTHFHAYLVFIFCNFCSAWNLSTRHCNRSHLFFGKTITNFKDNHHGKNNENISKEKHSKEILLLYSLLVCFTIEILFLSLVPFSIFTFQTCLLTLALDSLTASSDFYWFSTTSNDS